jgi:hypothetical protein
MGFNGEIVVFRSQADPKELGRFIGTEHHVIRSVWPLNGDWRAIYIRPYAEPYEYDDEWLAELSATTDAPVLACWVFESDVAHIRGLSSAGAWDCWLNLRYAASMLVEQGLDDDGPDLMEQDDPADAFDRYRSKHFEEESARLTREIPLAARKAAAWAEQAGYAVPAEPIEALLRAPRELFIQWGFFKLLYRLGLTDTDFDPNAED